METLDAVQLPYLGVVGASLIVILGIILLFPLGSDPFITINQHPWDLFQTKAKQQFEYNAAALLNEGLQTVSAEIRCSFRIFANRG